MLFHKVESRRFYIKQNNISLNLHFKFREAGENDKKGISFLLFIYGNFNDRDMDYVLFYRQYPRI